MADKELIKKWLVDIVNDNYVEADKKFPEIVKSAVQTNINNRKPAIVKELNAKAESTVIASSELKKADEKKEPETK